MTWPTTPGHGNCRDWSSSSATPSSNLSHLFNTSNCGVFMSYSARDSKVFSTVVTCASDVSDEMSTMWSTQSASATSSRVAVKPATSWLGSRWMKPTVSINIASLPLSNVTRLRVGSKVSNNRSWAVTSFEPQSRFISVDLPAFVYPTSARNGKPNCVLEASRFRCRSALIRSMSVCNCLMLSFSLFLSMLSCVSPAPFKAAPEPPPALPPFASKPAPSVK
mmetsp:Transcript_40/g.151  ORF Transcript_40/g.151 Transcript_40/m.151 type:complete len:221 (+) Transcript_40:494-1156(+)